MRNFNIVSKVLMIFVFLSFIGCCTLQKTTDTTTEHDVVTNIVTTYDTIPVFDTIPVNVVFKSEKERKSYGDSIYNKAYSQAKKDALFKAIQSGKFSTDTLRADNKYAWAISGVRNNVPFLELYGKTFDTTAFAYYNGFRVDKNTLTNTKDTTKTTVNNDTTVKLPFYQDNWFWAFVVTMVILLVYAFIRR